MTAKLSTLLARYRRIAITGGPGTGKTTLTSSHKPTIHTDDVGGTWASIGPKVAQRLKRKPRYVVEGVHVVEALAAGLAPDVLVVLVDPFIKYSPQQAGLARSINRRVRAYQGHKVTPCRCGGGRRCKQCGGSGWAVTT